MLIWLGQPVLAAAAAGTGQTGPSIPPPAGTAVVIMYHRFGETSLPSTDIRPDQVRRHLALIRHDGLHVVPLSQVVDTLNGKGTLPAGAVAITVDDGYASVYDVGWPILRAAKVPWTLFVNTASIGHHGYMTWDQVRELAAAGVTIGAHSHAHAHMTTLSSQQLDQDIDTMLTLFEQNLGQRPIFFAYPYGEADAQVIDAVRRHGFQAAFGQQSGAVGQGAGDSLWLLPRFALNEHYGTADRVHRILHAWPLPVTDLTPAAPFIPAQDVARPEIGFRLRDPSLAADQLACYGPHGGRLSLDVMTGSTGTTSLASGAEATGPRVRIHLRQALHPGRSRVNCTLPGPRTANGGRHWYWRGWELLVPGAWD